MKTRLNPWMQEPEGRALLTPGTHYYCYDHSGSRRGVSGGGTGAVGAG